MNRNIANPHASDIAVFVCAHVDVGHRRNCVIVASFDNGVGFIEIREVDL